MIEFAFEFKFRIPLPSPPPPLPLPSLWPSHSVLIASAGFTRAARTVGTAHESAPTGPTAMPLASSVPPSGVRAGPASVRELSFC